MARSICTEPDCEFVVHGYGLCRKHLQRADYQRKKAMGIKNPRSNTPEDPEATFDLAKELLDGYHNDLAIG